MGEWETPTIPKEQPLVSSEGLLPEEILRIGEEASFPTFLKGRTINFITE